MQVFHAPFGINTTPKAYTISCEDEKRCPAKGILLSKFNPNDYKSTKLNVKDIPQFMNSNVMDFRNIMFLKTNEIVMVFHGGSVEEYQRGPVTTICLDPNLEIKWISKGPSYASTSTRNRTYLGIAGCLSFEKEGFVHFLYNRPIAIRKYNAFDAQQNMIYPIKNNMELVAGKTKVSTGKYTEKAIFTYKKMEALIKPNEGTELMKGVYRFDTFKKKKYGFLTISF